MPDITGKILITESGEQAMLAGTLDIETVRFGDAVYTPSPTATGLVNEISAAAASGTVTPDPAGGFILFVNAIDQSGFAYDLHEFSLADDQGVALFIYSQPTVIATKAGGSSLTLNLGIRLSQDEAGNITITGATTYFLPIASEIEAGIVELATAAEATAGSDTLRVITPFGLAGAGLQNKRLSGSADTDADAAVLAAVPDPADTWVLIEKHEADNGRFVRAYTRFGGSSDDEVVWCRTVNAAFQSGQWTKDNNSYPGSRVVMSMAAATGGLPSMLTQWVDAATNSWIESGWDDGVMLDGGQATNLGVARRYGMVYRDTVPLVDCLVQLGTSPQILSGGNIVGIGYTLGGFVCELTLGAAFVSQLPDFQKAKVYVQEQSSIAGNRRASGTAVSNGVIQFSIYDADAAALEQLDAAGANNIKVAVKVTCGE